MMLISPKNRISILAIAFTYLFVLVPGLATAEEPRMHAVIVTFDLADSVKHDPETIRHAQKSLLADLASVTTENIKLYEYLPQMALTVDDAGLALLQTHPRVKQLHHDGVAAPLAPASAVTEPSNQIKRKHSTVKGLSETVSPCKIKKNHE